MYAEKYKEFSPIYLKVLLFQKSLIFSLLVKDDNIAITGVITISCILASTKKYTSFI